MVVGQRGVHGDVRGIRTREEVESTGAVEANARLGAVVELAHAQLDLARTLGAGPEATELIRRAEATASERGLAKVARRAAELGDG